MKAVAWISSMSVWANLAVFFGSYEQHQSTRSVCHNLICGQSVEYVFRELDRVQGEIVFVAEHHERNLEGDERIIR